RAPLRLVRQVKVFEALLRVGRFDARAQFGGELLLFLDARENYRAAFFELAQVAEPLLERAQLRVVETARDFLAIARDERHRRAFVEQRDGGYDLLRLDGEFGGNAGFDGRKHERESPREKTNG